MWKQISRGVRESLERCSLFGNRKDVAIRQEPQIRCQFTSPCRLRLLPCLVETFFHKNPVLHKKQNLGIDEHHEKTDSRDENCNAKTSSNFGQQYTFLGAMGWSGALVLGYVLSQRMWYKQMWFLESKAEPLKNEDQFNLLHLLPKIAEAQPINNTILSSKSTNNQNTSPPLSQEISADHALDDAIEELRGAHEKVIGEMENRRGVACLSRNNNREAIEHFRRASRFNNAPAAFNMGQCYELGIGTKQDFKQAAEWYQLASDRGHPTAMYNLGVFYAHGWGGLKANVSRARNLFHQAALLGQVDARAAIDRDPAQKLNVETSLIHKEDTKMNIKSAFEQLIQYQQQAVLNIRDN